MTTEEKAREYAKREIKMDKKIIVTPEELKRMAVDFYMAGHSEATRWRSVEEELPTEIVNSRYSPKLVVKINYNGRVEYSTAEYNYSFGMFFIDDEKLDDSSNNVTHWRYID